MPAGNVTANAALRAVDVHGLGEVHDDLGVARRHRKCNCPDVTATIVGGVVSGITPVMNDERKRCAKGIAGGVAAPPTARPPLCDSVHVRERRRRNAGSSVVIVWFQDHPPNARDHRGDRDGRAAVAVMFIASEKVITIDELLGTVQSPRRLDCTETTVGGVVSGGCGRREFECRRRVRVDSSPDPDRPR